MENKEQELIKGHTYLIKRGLSKQLIQAEVLMVTENAYQFKYVSGAVQWELKSDFSDDYSILEDISKFFSEIVIPYNEEQGVPNYVLCPPCKCCNGTGLKPTLESSSGFIICPICNGSKVDGYRFNKLFTRFESIIDNDKKD